MSAKSYMHPGEVGSCDQACEVCHQHFLLLYLWDYVAPGEGRWVCMACLAPALYADSVRIVEEERDRLRNEGLRNVPSGWAFGPGPTTDSTDRVLHRLAQKLQRRASRVLGMEPPPPRYMG